MPWHPDMQCGVTFMPSQHLISCGASQGGEGQLCRVLLRVKEKPRVKLHGGVYAQGNEGAVFLSAPSIHAQHCSALALVIDLHGSSPPRGKVVCKLARDLLSIDMPASRVQTGNVQDQVGMQGRVSACTWLGDPTLSKLAMLPALNTSWDVIKGRVLVHKDNLKLDITVLACQGPENWQCPSVPEEADHASQNTRVSGLGAAAGVTEGSVTLSNLLGTAEKTSLSAEIGSRHSRCQALLPLRVSHGHCYAGVVWPLRPAAGRVLLNSSQHALSAVMHDAGMSA